jgi:hypothetical protein
MTSSRPCPTRRRSGARALATLALGALAAGAALTGGAAPASAASASAPMMFGAVASTKTAVAEHETTLGGSTLRGLRVYKNWGDPLFGVAQTWARDTGHTLFMSIRSKRQDGTVIPWAQIAAAQPGTPLYLDMQSQAQQIKAFGATAYIAFNHEPEAAEARSMGTSAEFVAAYQKVETVWKAAGVTNVRYVFAATAYGFVRKDAYKAANYYPGDDFVDEIGADGYNWADCRTPGGKWKELSTVIEGQRQFGLLHPSKGLMLYEFGSAEDRNDPGHKAQWLRNALAMFQQPAYGQYRAALSWEGRSFTGGGPDCGFDYKSSPAATQAWVDMAHSPVMAASSLG